ILPGDSMNALTNITKIVSSTDQTELDQIAALYDSINDAGIDMADTIKIAEAAKVIENAQRDINIAFANELAMICHKMGIHTKSVLQAAATKWNFLEFTPGLVGGHCIGVDRSEEHTSELQSRFDLVCRLLLENKNRHRLECSCS